MPERRQRQERICGSFSKHGDNFVPTFSLLSRFHSRSLIAEYVIPSSILFFSLPFPPSLKPVAFLLSSAQSVSTSYIYIRYAWFRIQRVAKAGVTYAGKQRQVRGLIRRFLTRMNTYNEARNCCVRTWRYRFNKGFRSCARFCITLLSKWPE